MITSYSFGRIRVDGKEFKKDLIILPDGTIHHPWWRKSGHRLSLDDLGPVLEAQPKVLIIGTGSFGVMIPDPGLVSELAERGINARTMATKTAVAEYNSLIADGENVAACFHLTC